MQIILTNSNYVTRTIAQRVRICLQVLMIHKNK